MTDERWAKVERLKKLEEYAKLRASKRLHDFVKLMWHTVEPQRPFKDNWHIQAVCDHLEAVRRGQIKTLVINQPPATTKSLTASVMFPAWCWATAPWMRFMCLSFDQSLSSRDNVRMRSVVTSAEYQHFWNVTLSDDQNEKTRYHTTAGGWRIGTSVTGRIIGEHPHGKIVDDPHDPKKGILSELELKTACDVWDLGLSTRGATLGAWSLLMMQRLHENDLSGYVLAKGDPDVILLCLPMKYEPPAWFDLGGGQRELRPRMKTTPLGWDDPRTEPGELLWPDEWDAAKVKKTVETQLGSWGESGQFQQRPSPVGGLMFKRAQFNLIERAPDDIVSLVRFWDVAGTEGGSGARTSGVKMGLTKSGRYVILDIEKGRWSDEGVESRILQTAQLDGVECAVREEQEPGSAGLAVVKGRQRLLALYDYKGVRTTGDKVIRARPFSVRVEAGKVDILAGTDAQREMAREFLNEVEAFPLGALKDQVDSAAGAYNTLAEHAMRGRNGLLFVEDSTNVDAEIERLERELGMQSSHASPPSA